DLADRYQSPHTGEQNSQREQVDQRPLLSDRYRRPEVDEAGREVDAGHEAVNVVQPWFGLRLAQVHLQRAAEHRDAGDEEQTHPNYELARCQRFFAGHFFSPVVLRDALLRLLLVDLLARFCGGRADDTFDAFCFFDRTALRLERIGWRFLLATAAQR